MEDRVFDFGDANTIDSINLTSIGHDVAEEHNMSWINDHTVFACWSVIFIRCGLTHGVLDFVNNGFTRGFDAEILAHVGNVISRCSSADDSFGIHDVTKAISFNQKMIMSWSLFNFTDYRSGYGRYSLRSVRGGDMNKP